MQKGILGSVIAVLGVAVLLITMVPSAFALTVKAGEAVVHYRPSVPAVPAQYGQSSQSVAETRQNLTTVSSLAINSDETFASPEEMEKFLADNPLFPASGNIIVVDAMDRPDTSCNITWDEGDYHYRICRTVDQAMNYAKFGDLIALTPGKMHYVENDIFAKKGVSIFGTRQALLINADSSFALFYANLTATEGEYSLYSGFSVLNDHDRSWGGGIQVARASGLMMHSLKFVGIPSKFPLPTIGGDYRMYCGVSIYHSQNIWLLNSALVGIQSPVIVSADRLDPAQVYLENNEIVSSAGVALNLRIEGNSKVEIVNNSFYDNQVDLMTTVLTGVPYPTVDLTANGFFNHRHQYQNMGDFFWYHGSMPRLTTRAENLVNQDPLYLADTLYKLNPKSPYREAGWNRLGGEPTDIGMHGGFGVYNFLPIAEAR